MSKSKNYVNCQSQAALLNLDQCQKGVKRTRVCKGEGLGRRQMPRGDNEIRLNKTEAAKKLSSQLDL